MTGSKRLRIKSVIVDRVRQCPSGKEKTGWFGLAEDNSLRVLRAATGQVPKFGKSKMSTNSPSFVLFFGVLICIKKCLSFIFFTSDQRSVSSGQKFVL